MNFGIEDILNGTVDRVSKETLETLISEIIEEDYSITTEG
jgi:hypothetical protein